MTGIASRAQLRMSFLRWALVTVPAVLLLGKLSARLANSGYDNPWFAALAKPAGTPEGWVFAAAWTILFIMLGFVLAMLLHARGARQRSLAIGLFLAQLALAYAWSPIFFGMHQVTTALGVIVVMLGLAVAATVIIARIRKSAALLMLPYLAWLAFATMLNWQIVQLNPDAETLAPGGGGADIIL